MRFYLNIELLTGKGGTEIKKQTSKNSEQVGENYFLMIGQFSRLLPTEETCWFSAVAFLILKKLFQLNFTLFNTQANDPDMCLGVVVG